MLLFAAESVAFPGTIARTGRRVEHRPFNRFNRHPRRSFPPKGSVVADSVSILRRLAVC